MLEAQTCWICGNDATTKEHLSKRSDIIDVFGQVTQKTPLFLNSEKLRNKRIQSSDSKFIKSKTRICGNCNSSLTQPYDRAWEKMSNWLQAYSLTNHDGRPFKAKSIFPYDTKKQLLLVHLYFVKLFGMHICGDSIPIDLGSFSKSILEAKPQQQIYLRFGSSSSAIDTKVVGTTDLATELVDGVVVRADWLYIVDRLIVSLCYSARDLSPRGKKPGWNPKFNTSKISFLDYDEEVLIIK